VLIKNITQESTSYRFLTKLESDVQHICKMKAAEWEKTVNCGAFVIDLDDSIKEFLSNDLKTCSKAERTLVKECLVEVRKILRLLQTSYKTKVSSLTIHCMVSDIRNYVHDTRIKFGKVSS
jgi:hypothetical protein